MGILKILRRFLLFSVTHFASLLFLSIFIAGTIIVSCVREEVLDLKEKSYEQSEIMDAMQWFEERIYAENYMLSESGMQLYKDWMPDWSKATFDKSDKCTVVEVPLLFKRLQSTIVPEAQAEYEKTGDPKYLQNDIRLIIKKDLASGNREDIIMKIIPSPNYIVPDNSTISFLHKDNSFDGYILYYDPNWNFKAGFVYGEGEITKSLVKTSSDVKTRLMQEMDDEECLHVYAKLLMDWYVNGIYDKTTEVGWEWIRYECYMMTEGNYGEYDQYGYNNDGGGQNNQQYQEPSYQQKVQNNANALEANLPEQLKTLTNKFSIRINDGFDTSLSQYGYILPSVTNSLTTILFNSNVSYEIYLPEGLTEVQQKHILAHEYMHLYLFDISRTAGSNSALMNKNLELFSYLNTYNNLNTAHHEYMGSHIDDVEWLLRDAFPNESNDFYRYGKWACGAFDSEAFESLSQTEKNAIINYLRKHELYDEQ